MASKLKIIPLGGLGEIGKNLTVYEYGKDMFLVDCGMGFPDQDLYGVDMVIPDISYLKANKNRIRGMVITHGHEDHIGAIPYVLKQLDMPIYATPLTAAIIELKLEEHDLLYHTQIFTKKPGDKFKLGCFEIEFIHTNHSIADSVALAIKTPIGTVIHTGDFKIDLTPIQGGMIDLPRLGQLGNEGVLALLSDSTNVERPGYCASEARVIDCFDELFKDCNKRIIVTTFASNVHRLQQIINVFNKITLLDNVRIALRTPDQVGIYTVYAITNNDNYNTGFGMGALVVKKHYSGVKLDWNQNFTNGKLSAADVKNFDFGATLSYNGEQVEDQSSVHYLYSGFTSRWRPYSSTTTPPTEPGRYVVTVVTLGGNYQAAPITRAFQITK